MILGGYMSELENNLNNTALFYNSLPLSSLVKDIMNSCVEAQTDAAEATKKYFEQFVRDSDNPNKVAEVKFSYIADGTVCHLVLPLITILPIPILKIDTVNINFEAETELNNDSLSVNMIGTNRRVDETKEVVLNSNLSVNINAQAVDMPSGMAKMLEIIGNNGILVEDIDEIPGLKKLAPEDDIKRRPIRHKPLPRPTPKRRITSSITSQSVSSGEYLSRITKSIKENGEALAVSTQVSSANESSNNNGCLDKIVSSITSNGATLRRKLPKTNRVRVVDSPVNEVVSQLQSATDTTIGILNALERQNRGERKPIARRRVENKNK